MNKLTVSERKDLAEEAKMRQVAELYLDLEHGYTWEQIAEQTGLTVGQVRYMTSKEKFREIYQQHLAHITGRILLSVRHNLATVALPEAFQAHLAILRDPEAKDSVRLSAVRLLYQILGIGEGETVEQDDRDELRRWQKALQGGSININVLVEGLQRETMPTAPIDATYRELPPLEGTSPETAHQSAPPLPQSEQLDTRPDIPATTTPPQ